MSEFSGFYKLSVEERLKRVKEHAKLTDAEAAVLSDEGALKNATADKMIENVIGTMHLPLALATNFRINGKDYIIPMAVEEPSVVAAACRAAKQTLPQGFKAEADEPIMIGQLQITDIDDILLAQKNLEANKAEVLNKAAEFMKPHERYGCGVHDVEWRVRVTGSGTMLVLNFMINVGDAQGANMVNTTLEGVTPFIIPLTGGQARLRIVSNLADRRKVAVSAVWKKDAIGENVISGVLEAYEFAKADIYRCATHNKGIMNGIDAVAIATGNDWRSVEAGAHCFASMGQYHPLTRYEKNEKGDLVGTIELPMAVATVGPAISTNPTTSIAIKIIGAKSSRELAMAIAAVGLANNFAALSALSTEGIQKGHMKLHARNIAAFAGAKDDEVNKVAEKLGQEKKFTVERAKEILEEMRA
ncbi:MAG: hydroxymethylglutaryl-CoA reductase, degradative [Candidatus Micrarchaeota archaeon]